MRKGKKKKKNQRIKSLLSEEKGKKRKKKSKNQKSLERGKRKKKKKKSGIKSFKEPGNFCIGKWNKPFGG